ncbi:MAG: tetratricopeptide repeat protein [Rudaea sp.]
MNHRRGDTTLARKAAEDALALDADNSQAKTLLAELGGAPRPSAIGEGSPVEQAQRSSLSRLAEAVFEEGSRSTAGQPAEEFKPVTFEVDALTARAIDAQTHGRLPEAIDCYEQIVKTGTRRSEVFFNLGTLYVSVQRYAEAVEMLERTVAEPEYSLPSLMALGNSYQAMGRIEAAQDSYLRAMRVLDLSTVGRDQVDQVIGLYQSVADGYRGRGETGDAESFMSSLVDFLNGKGWEDKVLQVREHMQAMAERGTAVELAEILETNDAGKVIEALRLSQRHLENGLVNSASDEALRAIEIAPDYLPAHLQLAEVLESGGRLAEAREKYEMLAETAYARGDVPKAISFSKRSLAISPGDLDRRAKLIDLLVRRGQLEDALSEFAAQGDAIEKTGEHRTAVETFIEGLQLADRVDRKSPAAASLRSRLADSYVRARDWRNAIPVLEQIVELAPRDERSRFLLADLYFRVRQREKGERHLDELLRGCGKNSARASAILGALAKNLPKETSVNIRLARALAGAGEATRAVELLDRLGDEMLAIGERDQAVLVIQEIIALDPPQAEDYRRLLAELEEKRASDIL